MNENDELYAEHVQEAIMQFVRKIFPAPHENISERCDDGLGNVWVPVTVVLRAACGNAKAKKEQDIDTTIYGRVFTKADGLELKNRLDELPKEERKPDGIKKELCVDFDRSLMIFLDFYRDCAKAKIDVAEQLIHEYDDNENGALSQDEFLNMVGSQYKETDFEPGILDKVFQEVCASKPPQRLCDLTPSVRGCVWLDERR